MDNTKKPINVDFRECQEALDIVAAHATKGEIAAWTRKRKSIERLITNDIHPLEDQILELNSKLLPIYDKLHILRAEMVEACVHPLDMLIHKDEYIECKFCGAKLGVPNVKKSNN